MQFLFSHDLYNVYMQLHLCARQYEVIMLAAQTLLLEGVGDSGGGGGLPLPLFVYVHFFKSELSSTPFELQPKKQHCSKGCE